MVYENKENKGNAYCPKCKKRVETIRKMGGWICSICRRVLKY
jgi:ribosomal protein L37AE/L43A